MDKERKNLVNQANNSLILFQETGQIIQFIALQDQLDSFADEAFDKDLDKELRNSK